MMQLILYFIVSLILTASARDATITGKIVMPDGKPSNIRVVLNDGEQSVLSNIEGVFSFHDVPSGVHVVDILSVSHVFSQYKLKVDWENHNVSVVEYKFPGAPRVAAPYPLLIYPVTASKYFQEREKFSVYKLIMGNPMMLMMGFSALAVIFMPKLMQGLDKEQLKEMEKMQGGEDPMNNLKKMFGMDGKVIDDDDE